MLCPDDQTPLVMSERQGVEIDYCPRCRGVWLDRGELDKLIERNGGAAQVGEETALVPPTQVLAVQGDDGVWQDAHGTGAVRTTTVRTVPGAAPSGATTSAGYTPPAHLTVTRRRSWLEELFDF